MPEERRQLEPTKKGVAAAVWPVEEAGPHWLSIECTHDAAPTVVALPVLKGRLATLVAQVDRLGCAFISSIPWRGPTPRRSPVGCGAWSTFNVVARRPSGRCARSRPRGREGRARDDPFGGCLAGYVLLRLGSYEALEDLASEIIEVAPKLSDAYILRGECEASRKNVEGRNQAFADAAGTGVPAFGEGLTRLVEGLRAGGFVHPRGALVRYVFQRHARGSMWSAFTPRSKFTAGRLVITGADVGYEG